MTVPESLRAEAREIFRHALDYAQISPAMDRSFRIEDGALIRLREDAGVPAKFSLLPHSGITVIALGKAASAMLDGLCDRLKSQFAPASTVRGLCCAPAIPADHLRHPEINYFAGGHPLPNADSLRSALAALALLQSLDSGSLVLFLVSGGGSAMFDAPLDPGISLEDMVAFHRVLIGSGAPIADINVVRKHFSAVKGGRLAAAAGAAKQYSLFISDVPEGHLDALASGPTLPDSSTVTECREVLLRYGLLPQFPRRVREFFLNPALEETPKPADFAACASPRALDVLLSNHDLLEGAEKFARSQDWTVVVDNSCDDWDYRDAARYLLNRLKNLEREHRRVCLLSGGEVTVRLSENPGVGGRNQQFAMACALELAGSSSDRKNVVLSAGSDGVDGISPAAGAVVNSTTVSRAAAAGWDSHAALENFDCYPLFAALGDAVVTGPTQNNLRDLRILLSS